MVLPHWMAVSLALVLLSQAALSADSARPVEVLRLPGNPIIRPEMLRGGDGANINGPSLIRAPSWLTNRLGLLYSVAGESGIGIAELKQGP